MCERDSLFWEAHEQNDQGHILAFSRRALQTWPAGSILTNVRSLGHESVVGESYGNRTKTIFLRISCSLRWLLDSTPANGE